MKAFNVQEYLRYSPAFQGSFEALFILATLIHSNGSAPPQSRRMCPTYGHLHVHVHHHTHAHAHVHMHECDSRVRLRLRSVLGIQGVTKDTGQRDGDRALATIASLPST